MQDLKRGFLAVASLSECVAGGEVMHVFWLLAFAAGLVWKGVSGGCGWHVCTLTGRFRRPVNPTGRALAVGV